jgi:pyruvate/2-oxoglutarate dehydrogenase complex dihydrolipoamide dehydrogenase (E3) component
MSPPSSSPSGGKAMSTGLGLDAAGVMTDRHAIPVDDYLRTNVEHIFAVGDVNGRSMLVQSARLEGRIAAQNAIEGPTRRVSYDVVPCASFTDPEYGSVGLTEAAAAVDNDIVIGVARYGYASWSSAICSTCMSAAMHAATVWTISADYSPITWAPRTVCRRQSTTSLQKPSGRRSATGLSRSS